MAFTDIQTEFVGKKTPLFKLAFWASVKTVLTLGFYRFWMKTRLRRFYWSSIRPGGHPLEYLGEPLEKLLGFLIAVVFLAFYLGIVNLILMFISFSLLDGPFAAYALSFVGIVPILFYAQYRARRYILARTRWRGIRFGLEPGAWGYSWRALLHWLSVIVTLGALWPRKTFWLEKYKTDRTWYGNVRLTQNGTWTMLIPAMLHLAIGVVSSAAVAGGAYLADSPRALPLLMITGSWAMFGFVYYRVNAFRLLTEAKTADGIEFAAAPRTGRVLGIYVGGSLLIYLSMLAVFFIAFFAIAILLGSVAAADLDFEALFTGETVPFWVLTVIGMAAYFALFILMGVFTHIFLTLPMMRHYAETLSLSGAERLTQISQRERDEFAEAEGFAEALDVGAAI